jgi:hypothetical protein
MKPESRLPPPYVRPPEAHPFGDYNAADDMRRSIEFAYAAIRERVKRGGRGWRGWPMEHDPTRTVAKPITLHENCN